MAFDVPLRVDAILAEFEKRHKQGIVHYDDEPEIQLRIVDGFRFEFAVTAAISKKPYIKDNQDEPPSAAVQTCCDTPSVRAPSGYAPGSDIDVSLYTISPVSSTHLLAFNKFCMYQSQMLLLTADGYRRQYEHLNLQDFQAAWKMMEVLSWKYFMFFNCGKDGGCSRLHKHMQLSPYQRGRLMPWPETTRDDPVNAPYEYVLRRFEKRLGPKQICDLYGRMVEEARDVLGPELAESHVPHNLVLGRNWILLIPRRRPGFAGAYANSLGMLGMVSVASRDELKCWFDQGPVRVLEQLGVPRQQKGILGTTTVTELATQLV